MEVPYNWAHHSQIQYPDYSHVVAVSSSDHDNWYQSQPFLGWSPEMVPIQSPMSYYPYTSGTEFQASSYQFQSQYSYAHIPVFSGVDTPTVYAPPATEHHDLYLNVEPYNSFITSAVNQCEVVYPNSESIIPVPQVFDESFDRGMQASQSIKEEFHMSEELREEILKRLAEMREILSGYKKGESAEIEGGSVLNQKDKGEGSDPSIQSEVKLFDESPKPVLLHKEDSSEVLSSEESEATVEVNEEAVVVIKGEITDVKVFEERPQPVLASVEGFSEIIRFNGIVANSAHELFNENIADTRKVLNHVVDIEPKPPDSINAGVTHKELHPKFTMQFTVQNLQSDVISKEVGTSEADVCNLNDFFYKKQTATVDKFYDDLMSLLPMVETYCEQLPEGVIVDVFVSGLTQEIRECVEAYRPCSISYALEMAVFHEKRILEVSGNMRSHGDRVEIDSIVGEDTQVISFENNVFESMNGNVGIVFNLIPSKNGGRNDHNVKKVLGVVSYLELLELGANIPHVPDKKWSDTGWVCASLEWSVNAFIEKLNADEEMTRRNQIGRPQFMHLFSGITESEVTTANDYFLWMNKKCSLKCDVDKEKQQTSSLYCRFELLTSVLEHVGYVKNFRYDLNYQFYGLYSRLNFPFNPGGLQKFIIEFSLQAMFYISKACLLPKTAGVNMDIGTIHELFEGDVKSREIISGNEFSFSQSVFRTLVFGLVVNLGSTRTLRIIATRPTMLHKSSSFVKFYPYYKYKAFGCCNCANKCHISSNEWELGEFCFAQSLAMAFNSNQFEALSRNLESDSYPWPFPCHSGNPKNISLCCKFLAFSICRIEKLSFSKKGFGEINTSYVYSRTTCSWSIFYECSIAAKSKKWFETNAFTEKIFMLVLVGACLVTGGTILTLTISVPLASRRCDWTSTGGIMISITMTEILFADLGHFAVSVVQLAFTIDPDRWVLFVLAVAPLIIMCVWHYSTMKCVIFERHKNDSLGAFLDIWPSTELVYVPGIGLVHTELAIEEPGQHIASGVGPLHLESYWSPNDGYIFGKGFWYTKGGIFVWLVLLFSYNIAVLNA